MRQELLSGRTVVHPQAWWRPSPPTARQLEQWTLQLSGAKDFWSVAMNGRPTGTNDGEQGGSVL